MKVVISQCKGCYENNQILTDYPILQKYADKGYYVKYCNDYSDYDSPAEHWDFCHECALSVKQSMIKNIVDYEKEKS